MPNFDKTGPKGRRPLTGRQMGKCNDNEDTVEEFEAEDESISRPRRLFLQRRKGSNRPRRGRW